MLKILSLLLLLNLQIISCHDSGNDTSTEVKVLSRKKRYLIFPQGSSFSVATCMTIGIYGNPQFSIFRWAYRTIYKNLTLINWNDSSSSWGLNYGFAYNLPTNASEYSKAKIADALRIERSIETKPMIQRRQRRDLFNRLEIAMNQ